MPRFPVFLASLTELDPHRSGLRRAMRAAIALPVALAITLYVTDLPQVAVFTGFGVVGLLITADFAGRSRAHVLAYAGTGVGGSLLIPIGWLVAGVPVLAAVTTALVAFVIALIAVVRGLLAMGAPAALLVFIVAVSSGTDPAPLGQALTAWWIAVLVSSVMALVIPRRSTDQERCALARSLAQAAKAARALWHGPAEQVPARTAAFDASMDELAYVYAGKPFRPSAATSEDRAVTVIVDHLSSIRALVRTLPEPSTAMPETTEDAQLLTRAVVDALTRLAEAMTVRAVLPDPGPLIRVRTRFREGTERAVLDRSRAGESLARIGEDVRREHGFVIAALLTEQMAQLARIANGAHALDLPDAAPVPLRRWRDVLLAQLDVHSPWFRNAVRSALALGIAMLVVSLTEVANGFWVLLGVISILRLDSSSTRRNAWQALIGTVLGVAVASTIVLLLGNHLGVLWLLLPLAVFIAAWSTVALSYPLAQAAFTGFILLMVNLVQWPTDRSYGELRILDIAIGAVIAVAIGLLLWPHGAHGELPRQVAATVRSTWSYLADVLRSFSTPVDPHRLATDLHVARMRSLRGHETLDMAIMQRGYSAPGVPECEALIGAGHLMIGVGRVLEDLVITGQPINGPAKGALDRAITAGDAQWASVTVTLEDGGTPAVPGPRSAALSPLGGAVTDRAEARGLVLAVWALDWLDRMNLIRVAAGQPRDLTAS